MGSGRIKIIKYIILKINNITPPIEKYSKKMFYMKKNV